MKEDYYIACELMECKACSSAFIARDERMLGQLSAGVRALFPAVNVNNVNNVNMLAMKQLSPCCVTGLLAAALPH